VSGGLCRSRVPSSKCPGSSLSRAAHPRKSEFRSYTKADMMLVTFNDNDSAGLNVRLSDWSRRCHRKDIHPRTPGLGLSGKRIGPRHELPTTRARARTSDEEVSKRKRCSGISVKRSP
jgi:hypothetical protein